MNGNYRWVWVLLKWLLLLGVPLFVLSAFVMQNLDRTSQLSLDLGLFAFELKQAWPIPALLASAFGLGFVIGEVHARVAAWRKGRISAPMSVGHSSDDDWV